MKTAKALGLAFITFTVCRPMSGQAPGEYLGTVQSEWLDDGRRMRLLSAYSYVDARCVKWVAPAGSIVDGASIPRAVWSIIGGPFEGKYRDASVIHDVACVQKTRRWESVHECFYWGMITSGVEVWRAKVMYLAVYHFGPRWSEMTAFNIRADKPSEAIENVRSKAVTGSSFKILGQRLKTRTWSQKILGRTGVADFDVQILPPQAQVADDELLRLAELIRNRESSNAPISLEEIRRMFVRN